ncbi:PHD-finger domain-containing protein, partial [Toxoplasma gondii FOU]
LSSSSSSSLSSSSLSSSSLSSASSSSLSSSSLSSSFHPSSCSSPQSSSPQPPSALPSSFHSPLSAFSSFASCRPGRWGNTAGGAGSSSKKRRRRGDETRINVGPDYQVPRLPEFYLSRTDETASAEEARCALFPFSPSLSACASLLVSSHASSSPFASQPSAASSFSFQERLYSQAAPCAAFRDAAQAEGLRGRSQAQTAGEEKKRFRAFPGCSLASPCGGYFLPPVFCSGDSAAALGAAGNFGAPPGSAFEDSRHSALEPRLVYSPRCLEEKRQQCLATGRMQHCIRTQGELADFVETCSRCWHARPGWQPFSAEFAYQLLHRAGYDPQRALRMLDDPGFCFNDICDPPLRKYDNKWKRRDKRGTFPNSPYPPPLVVQSFLQEKSRACRPSLSGTGSYAIR